MSWTLARKDPRLFTSSQLHVEASADGLIYQAVGMPLNFQQMQAKRRPISVANNQHFAVELANLGVSTRLTLQWQDHDYWLLVRQQRADRGDVVLKLISGYVPSHELSLPLHTALQEVAEECLLQTPQGWLSGSYAGTWLDTPYKASLHYRDNAHFTLSTHGTAAKPVYCASLPLVEQPNAYVHLPTASLQLVYDLRMELPKDTQQLSLLHVDEELINGELIAQLWPARPDLFLLQLNNGKPSSKLFTLELGQLIEVTTENLWLSESFAVQEGWVVREERVSWRDWQAQ